MGDSLVRTILPLNTWTLQKYFGPVFTPAMWKAVALSFVPPPENIVRVIKNDTRELDSKALLSPTERRRFRNDYKRRLRHQLRDNPIVVAARQHMLKWRQELESKGHTEDATQINKLREGVDETNTYYSDGSAERDLVNLLGPTGTDRLSDAKALCWEFAAYGEADGRPKIRLNSALWQTINVDPKKLEQMNTEEGFEYLFSQLAVILGQGGEPPSKARLRRMIEWTMRTHLPSEHEPGTTREAMAKAIEAGLVHKPIKVIDKESGKVVDLDIEDKAGLKPDKALEAILSPSDLIELFKTRGIEKSDLTEKDWNLISNLNDAFRKGAEQGSKTGISLDAYFGADSVTVRKQLSRLRHRIQKKIATKQQP